MTSGSPGDLPQAWPAPAKLNLMLRIVGRRDDGYHLLQTVFQFIDLCDTLYFAPQPGSNIALRGDLSGLPASRNLVSLAARALQRATGHAGGASITLRKRIPTGGGLGGGSSDAATTLLALNQIWQLGLSRARLAEIGLTLGADVPVFVVGQAAWAEGIGERLTPLQLDEPWYLVVHPGCEVATGEIFGDAALTRHNPPIKMQPFREAMAENHCLPVVAARYPEVNRALRWLSQFAPAHLSGTGACVFARFTERQAAANVAAQLPDAWNGYLVRGMNRHPLLGLQGTPTADLYG